MKHSEVANRQDDLMQQVLIQVVGTVPYQVAGNVAEL